VGKGNGKSDEAEEFYTLRRSQPATMAKSDWEPVNGVTPVNWYREREREKYNEVSVCEIWCIHGCEDDDDDNLGFRAVYIRR
jgi:hypothetical protein